MGGEKSFLRSFCGAEAGMRIGRILHDLWEGQDET